MSGKSALVKWDGDGTLALGSFCLMRVGLLVEGEPSYEEWEHARKSLSLADSSVHWWIGDWLNYGQRAYGQKFAQALEETEFNYDTLQADKWVSQRIEMLRRRNNLSWSHHREVAALEPVEQDELLEAAVSGKWTLKQLREAVKEKKILTAGYQAGSFPEGTFSVIYTDPPWEYFDQRIGYSASGAASAHYVTMPTSSICELEDTRGRPVCAVAAPNSALFLWATASCLPDALQVIEAWGFVYKAQFIWDKVRGFNGHYNDVRHELLLIGLRGSFPSRHERLRP